MVRSLHRFLFDKVNAIYILIRLVLLVCVEPIAKQSKAKQSKAKQSKAKQSKAKQSKAKSIMPMAGGGISIKTVLARQQIAVEPVIIMLTDHH